MAPRARTTPRKSPTQERSKATVEAILDATTKVLVKEGYDRASTNKIAALAGVSVGSLYQYFPSKEALVAALIEKHSNRMLALFEAQAAELVEAPIEVAVRAVVRTRIEAHRINPLLHRVFIEQVPRVGRMQKVAEIEARTVDLITAYLAAHAKEIRPANVKLAGFLLAQVIAVVTHGSPVRVPKYLDEDALIDETTDLILRYLVP